VSSNVRPQSANDTTMSLMPPRGEIVAERTAVSGEPVLGEGERGDQLRTEQRAVARTLHGGNRYWGWITATLFGWTRSTSA
jgi:hypothetical protein